jgi:hypothetical protein
VDWQGVAGLWIDRNRNRSAKSLPDKDNNWQPQFSRENRVFFAAKADYNSFIYHSIQLLYRCLLCCLSIPDKEQIWRQQRKKKLLESAEAAEKGDKSIAYPLLQSSFLPSFLWLLLFNCRITKPKGKKSATKKSCWWASEQQTMQQKPPSSYQIPRR